MSQFEFEADPVCHSEEAVVDEEFLCLTATALLPCITGNRQSPVNRIPRCAPDDKWVRFHFVPASRPESFYSSHGDPFIDTQLKP